MYEMNLQGPCKQHAQWADNHKENAATDVKASRISNLRWKRILLLERNQQAWKTKKQN